MKRGMAVVAVSMALCSWAFAQEQASLPELKKLDRYLGTWTYEGEDKTPATGGRVACEASRQWIAGGFFVESQRDCQTPRGDVKQLEVFGYDFQNRVYMYWGFNGSSVSTYTASSMDGDTVIWTGIGLSSGNRCTEVFARGATSTDRCETSRDGGNSWVLRAAGKSTKSPSRRAKRRPETGTIRRVR